MNPVKLVVGIVIVAAILGLVLWLVVRPRLGRRSSILPIADQIAAVKAEVGVITRIDCPLRLTGDEVEGETYYCGVYTAPLDYVNPRGDTLNLAFMVLRARNATPLPDPVVYLAGGPGQSGIVAANGSLYGDLRQDRDLVFPAQRGTLFSHRLGLDECVALLGEQMGRSELNAFAESFAGLEQLDRSLPYAEYLAQYRERAGALNARCHEAFRAAGLDPAQFTTANSANDLVGLVKALGYNTFNLHGVSYGTRLALETMRRHPDAGIRSVVLDSPVAPSADRLAVAARAVHDSVIRLFEVCAADASCHAAYPNLVARTNALIDQLAAAPIIVGERTIGRDDFIAQLTNLGGTRANYIPRMIAELENGETTTYLALANGEVGVQAVEGSALTSAVQEFVAQVSTAAAGVGRDNIMTSIRIVADVVKAARKPDPRSAMKAAASEKLAGAPELPAILARIDALTPQEIEELAGATAGAPQKVDEKAVALVADAQAKNNALFMLSGIVCHEELDAASVAAAPDAGGDLAIPALRASGALLATEVGNCTNYPMGEADPSYHDPVSSDIPTLILQGEFDVRTPLTNGRALVGQLAHATLAIIPQAGHETWTGAGCVAEIGRSFIMHPNQPPDLSCLAARQERFSLPGAPLKESVSR